MSKSTEAAWDGKAVRVIGRTDQEVTVYPVKDCGNLQCAAAAAIRKSPTWVRENLMPGEANVLVELADDLWTEQVNKVDPKQAWKGYDEEEAPYQKRERVEREMLEVIEDGDVTQGMMKRVVKAYKTKWKQRVE